MQLSLDISFGAACTEHEIIAFADIRLDRLILVPRIAVGTSALGFLDNFSIFYAARTSATAIWIHRHAPFADLSSIGFALIIGFSFV